MIPARVDRAALLWGTVFTLVGAAFLGQEWGWWQVRASIFVPVVLIVAGTVLVLTGLTRNDATR